jgi:hypothetical protein
MVEAGDSNSDSPFVCSTSSINLPSSRKRRRQAWKRRGDLGVPQRQPPEQLNRG